MLRLPDRRRWWARSICRRSGTSGCAQRMWLHWDGNNDSVEERNKSAAIGAGATPDSLDLAVDEAHRELDPRSASRRRYPAARIDTGTRRRGPPRLGRRRARAATRSSSPLVGQVTSLADIGTDPERLNSFTPELAARDEHDRRRQAVALQPFPQDRTATPTCRSTACGCARRTCTTDRCRRCARCSSPTSGRRVFYRAYDVYDWTNVGFVSSGPEAEARRRALRHVPQGQQQRRPRLRRDAVPRRSGNCSSST